MSHSFSRLLMVSRWVHVSVTCSSVARAIYTNTVTGTLIDSKRKSVAVGYVNEFGQVGGGTVICSKWKNDDRLLCPLP